MYDKHKDEITFTRYINDRVDKITTFNCTDFDASQYMDMVVDMMRLQGYGDVTIWRAFKDASEDMVQVLETVETFKDEWSEEK